MPQLGQVGPIQLAWMVNKSPVGGAMALNLLHHPDKLDGVADDAVLFALAHHLRHHRGKLDGVETATPKLALLLVFLTRLSGSGAA
ncbi:MAG TPA: hypothetical protein VJ783_15740 [Pirellulales bacterium]|nr:hypothetical protein [Pirellulales bacterium]